MASIVAYEHHERWDDEMIFKMFRDERAKQFNPKLIDIFFENIDDFLKIRDTLVDN